MPSASIRYVGLLETTSASARRCERAAELRSLSVELVARTRERIAESRKTLARADVLLNQLCVSDREDTPVLRAGPGPKTDSIA